MTATKLPPWDKDPNCWAKSSDPHQVLETCHSPPLPPQRVPPNPFTASEFYWEAASLYSDLP